MELYRILDVDPSAPAADIERAYLRLVRRYHPGINPGDRLASARYQQIQQAYDVLGDPAKRHDYDHGQPTVVVSELDAVVSFDGFDFSTPADGPDAATFSELFADVFQDAARRMTSPERGASVEIALRLSFEDAMRGGSFPVSVIRQERCAICAGAGRITVATTPCALCSGQGATRWARGHMVFTKACEACGGAGQITSQPCRGCAGMGVQARSEVVTLTIPAGIEDEARLAVPGRGHSGARGGPAGDLYVSIEVAPHTVFRREGRDLHVTLPVAVHEAALGARVDVPTLGAPVRLKIPPGTPSGTRLRLRGRGIPSALGADPEDAGDLLVEVQIVLPPVQDERSKELMREFGRLNPADVRRHLFER